MEEKCPQYTPHEVEAEENSLLEARNHPPKLLYSIHTCCNIKERKILCTM